MRRIGNLDYGNGLRGLVALRRKPVRCRALRL